MIITLLSILASVLAVSALIILHEAGHFLVARACGMGVERFSVGFGKVLFRVKRGETEFAISALPLGGYVAIRGMAAGEDVAADDRTAYANQPAWRRFAVILAGPAMNYLGAVVLAALLLLGPGLQVADPGPRVGRVSEGMPAAAAGLRKGDLVRAVDGVPVDSFGTLVTELQRHPGQAITLDVLRGEGAGAEVLRLPITLRDEGGKGRAGFGPGQTASFARGGADAVGEAFARTNAALALQISAFSRLFSRQGAESMTGPVGIVDLLVHAAQDGVSPFFTLVWMLSAVLAIFNLFPFPSLDGARLLFLCYELVTRRKVNARVEGVIHMVGLVAIIGLILAVTFKDLLRLAGR